MSELPISGEAMEAAAKALWDTDPVLSRKSPWGATESVMAEGRRRAGVMVRAFLEAEGFGVERNGDKEIPYRRLVSKWAPDA